MDKITYVKDNTKKLTKERKAVIDKYLLLQEGFKELHNKAILTYIAISKEQIETDISLVTKDMPKKEIDKLPKVRRHPIPVQQRPQPRHPDLQQKRLPDQRNPDLVRPAPGEPMRWHHQRYRKPP